jgi:ubiquinol-cytochrome c reductase cytochrome c1 subunit
MIGCMMSGGFAVSAEAAKSYAPIPQHNWSFDGIFGHFDNRQLQRGFKVYKEVCAACHGISLISFRNLEAIGYTEEEVKLFAATYTVMDGPNDEGEMFERPALPSDRIPSPYANEKAARAANNGAYPHDLSLMTKARPDGSNYVRALLLGFQDAPDDKKKDVGEGQYYNKYYGVISMAPVLYDDGITYDDGTRATREQMAEDVAAFLTWTADPHLEQRKRLGVRVMLFLIVLTALFYAMKRKIWRDVKEH